MQHPKRHIAPTVLTIFFIAGLITLGVVGPSYLETLPLSCPFRRAFGIPCPGCGLTRSIASLMQGDLGTSLHYNPFGAFIVAAAAVWMVSLKWPALRTRFNRVLSTAWIPIAVVAVMWVWNVGRWMIDSAH